MHGDREPTLEEIARRAGVSPRILLKYFSSVGGVMVVTATQVLDDIVARYGTLRTGPSLDERLAGFVDLRAEICEEFMPFFARTIQMARHTRELDSLIHRGRSDMREFVASLFGGDLRGLPGNVRRDLFDELCMIADVSSWRYLREACERTVEEAKTVQRAALRRVLAV